MFKVIKELVGYREMIFSLVKRDLRGKYKASILGFLWTYLIPLFQSMVYSFVFATIMRSGIDNFYIFLIVGLFPWNFFNAAVASGAACVVSQENLIKKIYFPRLVLPIAYVTSAFVNMLLTFIVIFLILIFTGYGMNAAAICFLPLVMLIEYILALGLCMVSSALTVYFRDLEYILGILMLAWMYLTPIFYEIETVPEEYKFIYGLNPMTSVIMAYREILYYKKIPEMSNLLQAVGLGLVFLVLGYLVFNRIQRRFVEEL